MLGGVKACSSAWLPLLLKPAPWKQEHTGHVRRKDFAPPRLIFCYLGKAAIIVKSDSFLSQVFFSSCPDGKGKSSTTNCYPEPRAGLQAQPRLLPHTHSFFPSGLGASEPLSHLPFHRVGSTACSSGLLQQNVYSLVTSSSQRQKWGCHGALLPQLSVADGF